MKRQFICYPKCTTCQKAKKWLDEQGMEYEQRHINMVEAKRLAFEALFQYKRPFI